MHVAILDFAGLPFVRQWEMAGGLAPRASAGDEAEQHGARRRGADIIGLSRSRSFIPELESLRGIAVLLVFTFHVHGFVLYPFPSASSEVSVPMPFIRAGHT